MNMTNFDSGVWFIHRKLFHRYMKFHKCFDKATQSVPEYKKALESDEPAMVKQEKVPEPKPAIKMDIISLLSSSSEDEMEGSVSDYDDV